MSYPLPTGSIVETIIPYRVSGQECMLVLHFKSNGSTEDGRQALIDLNDELFGEGLHLAGALKAVMGSNVSIGTPTSQLIYPTRFRKIENVGSIGNGLATAACNNPAAAVVISKQADVSGRHGVGNAHIGGVPDNAYTNGIVNGTLLGAYNQLGVEIQAVRGEGLLTFEPAIFQRALPSSSVTFEATATQNTLRTMRRRVVGRGI